MTARYGATRQPSSCWRVLADLCFIVGNLSFDADETLTALNVQRQRRTLELPTTLTLAGPGMAALLPCHGQGDHAAF